MTAKHRKGKNNHKNEDNFLKNEVLESEVRSGGSNHTLLLVLFLIVVIGGATGAWFCFQQHQTLTYVSDNLTGMQMKIVRLQSSHEEFRQTNHKVSTKNKYVAHIYDNESPELLLCPVSCYDYTINLMSMTPYLGPNTFMQ